MHPSVANVVINKNADIPMIFLHVFIISQKAAIDSWKLSINHYYTPFNSFAVKKSVKTELSLE